MRKYIIALLAVFTFSYCGDGDVIDFALDFDEELELCGGINNDNYLVYNIKSDPYESLILLFPASSTNEKIFYPETSPDTVTIEIGTSSRFNYRSYDGDPLEIICQSIPSSEVNITSDYESLSGEIQAISTYEDVEGQRTVTAIFTVINSDIEVLKADAITVGKYTHTFTIE